MNKFVVQDGQFWLNNHPLMIQAGEFHYFRTPKDQWRQRLDLLKAAGFNAVASYIPWLWHQVADGVSDFDGHSHPMRDLEGFLDLADEMGFLIIARPGPYINAETINEGIPPWVFEQHPQVAFTTQKDESQTIVSYLHPDFIACVRNWYREVFKVLVPRQITHDGKIILIQLDNEMGMMPWVRNIMDTNPDTAARFAAYIQKAYGESLPDGYPGSRLAEFLRESILHPHGPAAAQVVEDYRRFYREYLLEYVSLLWDEAKSLGMDVLPVANIHGFANGGKTFPIGLSQLWSVISLDGMVSAMDIYPQHIGEDNIHQLLLVNEMIKAVHNPEQPLFSIEFQAGGNQDFGYGQSSMFDLSSRLCISTGMRAVNHYLFFDGENHPILSPIKRHDWGHPVRKDGTLRKHYFRYPRLSRVLNSYDAALNLSQPQTVTTVGFLLNYFMTEVNNEATKEATNIITHQRDTVLFDMIARGLALTHRPFDAVEISRARMDPQQTPVCWVMMDKACDANTQQKLVNYVRDGGRLILAGRMCEETFDHQRCTILKDAIRINELNDDQPFTWSEIDAFNYKDIPVTFIETYTGAFDEVFARRGDEIVGFIKNLGKGLVMVFGAAMTTNTLEDLDVVNQMGLRMGSQPLFKLSTWADARISRGEKGSFLFINNYQDDPIETTIEVEGRLILGGNCVKLAARSGAILPVEWQVNPGILLHYSTAEVTEVKENARAVTIRMAQDEFFAEITAPGYRCEQAAVGEQPAQIHGTGGMIILVKAM